MNARILHSVRDWFLRWNSQTRAEWHAFRTFPDDVRYRLFTPDDEAGCVALYRLLESGFPREGLDSFITCLSARASAIIVAERGGKVAGMGGISMSGNATASLYYGLVDPVHQGCGIGTALTLLRLSALPASDLSVFIWTLQQSQYFYCRFGFRPGFQWQDSEGIQHPGSVLNLDGFRPDFVRRVLQERGVALEGELILPPCTEPVIERIRLPEGTYEFRFPGLEDR